MTRTNEVDQSFRPNMSYKLKVQASGADMSYKPKIDNWPYADNIKVTNNVKNGEGKRYKKQDVSNPDHSYGPKVVDEPRTSGAKNNNGVNQDFGADMSYNPNSKETGRKHKENVENGPGKSFSPIMSYIPKVSHNPKAENTNGVNQAFGAKMSYSPNIGNNNRYSVKGSFSEIMETKLCETDPDMSYKHRAKVENSSSPDMSYKPEVSSTPQAIYTNGVNQAFRARMSYSPDIAENTKLTGPDMSYIPRITNMPRFHDK